MIANSLRGSHLATGLLTSGGLHRRCARAPHATTMNCACPRETAEKHAHVRRHRTNRPEMAVAWPRPFGLRLTRLSHDRILPSIVSIGHKIGQSTSMESVHLPPKYPLFHWSSVSLNWS
jgi:hypothetical protein